MEIGSLITENKTRPDLITALCLQNQTLTVTHNASPNLNCNVWQSHGDPYLKLCPFKIERLWKDPLIMVVMDFLSEEEMKELKSEALNKKMRSTPYM